jgi:hypothetical protein
VFFVRVADKGLRVGGLVRVADKGLRDSEERTKAGDEEGRKADFAGAISMSPA